MINLSVVLIAISFIVVIKLFTTSFKNKLTFLICFAFSTLCVVLLYFFLLQHLNTSFYEGFYNYALRFNAFSQEYEVSVKYIKGFFCVLAYLIILLLSLGLISSRRLLDEYYFSSNQMVKISTYTLSLVLSVLMVLLLSYILVLFNCVYALDEGWFRDYFAFFKEGINLL